MNIRDITNLLLLLSPLFLIQFALAIYALIDLNRREHVRGKRWLWMLLLVIGAAALPTGLILSGLYLTWGRNIEAYDDTR